MSEPAPQSQMQLSIGAVSRETGIAVETLRTWERRYGFPSPQRTPGGHRVYGEETVEKLRLVSRALAAGHRAAQVVPAPVEQLRVWVGSSAPPAAQPEADFSLDEPMASWVRSTAALDGEALDAGFRSEWNRVGALRFLQDRAAPFLEAIGAYWADGRIGVLHEHFASERLRDFLAQNWRPLSDQQSGPRVICACLPEERHHLTLHMLAIVLSMAGCRVVFLGADTPLADIEAGARQADPIAVFVSISRAADPRRVRNQLIELRGRIDPTIHLVAGGPSAPTGIDGVTDLRRLDDLAEWSKRLVANHRSN